MGSNKVEADENDSKKHNLGTTHHIVSRKNESQIYLLFLSKTTCMHLAHGIQQPIPKLRN